jgi:hypothetical protein
VAALAATVFTGAAMATTGDATTAELQAQIERMQKSMEQLSSENQANKQALHANNQELAALKSQNGEKWLTEERASQIRGMVQEVMSDADTRASLQSTAATSGYNNGFFIASPDGNFRLQVNGQVQLRYAYSRLSNAGWDTTAPLGSNTKTRDTRGFEIRRAKLSFSGNVVDPSWQYKVTLAYLPPNDQVGSLLKSSYTTNVGDGSVGNGSSSTANLEDAYILKDFGNGISLTMGQFKSPFLREELVSSKYQLAVERSIVNQLFSTGWTDGIMLTAQNDNLMGMISFNNGGNNANFATNNSGSTGTFTGVGFGNGAWSQYAFTGRMQWLALGNWNQFNSLSSARGDTQGLLLGAGFNWQHGGNQNVPIPPFFPLVGGGVSNIDAGFLTYTVDASWDFGGANLYGAFTGNLTGSLPNLGAGNGSAIQSYGVIVQGGYFLTDDMEAFGRYEWYETASQGGNQMVAPGTQGPLFAQQNTILTGGLNWYINKGVKFTFDAGWSNAGILFTGGIYGSAVAGTNYQSTSNNAGGGQWVFRGQMQLVF